MTACKTTVQRIYFGFEEPSTAWIMSIKTQLKQKSECERESSSSSSRIRKPHFERYTQAA